MNKKTKQKQFLLKWRGTGYILAVVEETLIKAKMKFCKEEQVNPLLCADRVQKINSCFYSQIRKFI